MAFGRAFHAPHAATITPLDASMSAWPAGIPSAANISVMFLAVFKAIVAINKFGSLGLTGTLWAVSALVNAYGPLIGWLRESGRSGIKLFGVTEVATDSQRSAGVVRLGRHMPNGSDVFDCPCAARFSPADVANPGWAP
eukprot:gnl/MRDRNA2_/MRDRNA2_74541_c0_seq1.p1 gnl/MRDRNA2_/MRDRNA2_74541_c0~~gnl/MRDRNA2_/MRDRNA2_74541_c0_seq1.p1  ORF type:complete len:139 (+),score=0.60 gnl/MRDRNA2_/MRDRNA2_74541_c0_seq1:153-569(+)